MRGAGTLGKRVGYGWLYNWYAAKWFAPWEAKDYDEGESVSYGGRYYIALKDIIDILKPPSVNTEWGDCGVVLNIAPDDWRVPSVSEFGEMETYLLAHGHITSSNIGGALKSTKNDWLSPNTSATDEFQFSGLPGGRRSNLGVFGDLREVLNMWTVTPTSETEAQARGLQYDSGVLTLEPNVLKKRGYSVRCLQNKGSGESDGNTGTLTDVDGNVYPWVVIGDYRWMTENLRTTKYRDGTAIPEVTSNTNWGNDTTGARCAYDNDEYFVYPPNR